MVHIVSCEFAGHQMSFEVGKLAKQADCAVLVRYADTVALVTACVTDEPTTLPFLPLRVDFEEKMYAAGKIPGGFFKREGKPSDETTIMGRGVDRAVRPLLPSGLRNDVQVIVNPLSVTPDGSLSVVALTGAGAAMHCSRIPFHAPFVGVQVGRVDDELVVNPHRGALEEGAFNLLVAVSREGFVQIEMEGAQISETVLAEAFQMAYDAAQPVLDALDELRELCGKPKADFPMWEPDAAIVEFVQSGFGDRIAATVEINDKAERSAVASAINKEILEGLPEELASKSVDLEYVFESIQKKRLQAIALEENRRADGRGWGDIRDLTCEVGLFPTTHGSGLFTRGDTQVLTLTTLGAWRDQRMVRTLEDEEEYVRFTHHYNFPPFSTGEVRGLRAPGRREVGHGALASKAIQYVLPPEEEFPYTVRCVSEVLGGDASTSMAAACASSLALMDAGAPLTAPVAGIAIGLVYESEDNFRVFTDMQAIEDFLGHMDFKVAGTRDGVNAIQVDTKLTAIPMKVCLEALEQAKTARLSILDTMAETIPYPRSELSAAAPRMFMVTIPQDRIGMVIGPGGSNVRKLQETYEVQIDINDEGQVYIFGEDAEKTNAARQAVSDMTREVEVGEVFTGTVASTTPFGAFVEIIPGRDGLLHISHIDWNHVNKTEDVLNVGDEVTVKVIEVDSEGKVRLSRKELLPKPEGGGDGGRGGDRGGSSRGGGSRGGSSRGGSRGGGSRGGSSRGGSDRSDKTRGDAGSSDKPKDDAGASNKPRPSAPIAEEAGDFEAGRGKAYFRDKKS